MAWYRRLERKPFQIKDTEWDRNAESWASKIGQQINHKGEGKDFKFYSKSNGNPILL